MDWPGPKQNHPLAFQPLSIRQSRTLRTWMLLTSDLYDSLSRTVLAAKHCSPTDAVGHDPVKQLRVYLSSTLAADPPPGCKSYSNSDGTPLEGTWGTLCPASNSSVKVYRGQDDERKSSPYHRLTMTSKPHQDIYEAPVAPVPQCSSLEEEKAMDIKHNEDATDGVVKFNEYEITEGIHGARSKWEDLDMKSTFRLFWKGALVCFLAAFSSFTDGYQVSNISPSRLYIADVSRSPSLGTSSVIEVSLTKWEPKSVRRPGFSFWPRAYWQPGLPSDLSVSTCESAPYRIDYSRLIVTGV